MKSLPALNLCQPKSAFVLRTRGKFLPLWGVFLGGENANLGGVTPWAQGWAFVNPWTIFRNVSKFRKTQYISWWVNAFGGFDCKNDKKHVVMVLRGTGGQGGGTRGEKEGHGGDTPEATEHSKHLKGENEGKPALYKILQGSMKFRDILNFSHFGEKLCLKGNSLSLEREQKWWNSLPNKNRFKNH